MNFSPAIKLVTGELADELQFAVTRTRGWIDYMPIAALCLIVLSVFPNHHLWGGCIALAGGIAIYATWTDGPVTSLRVTADQITPGGNLSKTFTSAITIPVPSVTSIAWNPGRENEPRGLYVWQGWSRRCVLAEIGQEQAKEIREAIARRFPEIPLDDDRALSVFSEREISATPLELKPRTFERPTES